ncbi:MAG: hypothetical protein AAFR27_00770 [Pseudomonadota bacterium]
MRFSLWLAITKEYEFRDDLFTRVITSDEAFLQYATTVRPKRHQPIIYRSKSREEIDAFSRVLKTMFEAHSSRAFDKPHVAKYVIPAAKDLTEVVAHTDVVADYLDAVCGVFALYRPCPGCGCGAQGFEHLLPLADIIFEREDDVLAAISDPDRKLAFAHILERKLSWLRMQGAERKDEVVQVADSLVRIVFDDLFDHKDKSAVLTLAKHSKSASHGSPAFEQLREAVSEWFGEHSMDAVGFQRCLACKRISECADGKAKEFLDSAREVQIRALEFAMRKGDMQHVADLRETALNLDFLEAAWLEGQCGPDTDMLHTRLRRNFCDGTPARLKAMFTYYHDSPLRLARVHYWLWAYEDIKTPDHLLAAQRCLAQRSSVQELCVLDVPSFKRKLERALGQFTIATDRAS